MARPEYYGNPAGITDEIEIVRAVYDAFARRDIEAMLDYLAPDCELYLEGTARVAGREGPYRGHDGMREYFADVERLWDELVLHAEDYPRRARLGDRDRPRHRPPPGAGRPSLVGLDVAGPRWPRRVGARRRHG